VALVDNQPRLDFEQQYQEHGTLPRKMTSNFQQNPEDSFKVTQGALTKGIPQVPQDGQRGPKAQPKGAQKGPKGHPKGAPALPKESKEPKVGQGGAKDAPLNESK